jgi:hypothetical protein
VRVKLRGAAGAGKQSPQKEKAPARWDTVRPAEVAVRGAPGKIRFPAN